MPEQELIKLDVTKQVAIIQTKISQAEVAAEQLTIKTVDDLPKATELLGKIKTVGKVITTTKESITKPMNEALRAARSMFAPIEMTWGKAEAIVKNKMVDFHNAELKKAEKQTAAIDKKVEAGKMTPEKAVEKTKAITPQKNVTTTGGAAQFRTVKEVEIVDETLIPREYFALDLVKVRKVALAGVAIAGVRVVEKQVVAGIVK